MAFDTIAAIATPIGIGGVGIIRISGPDALQVARRLAPSLPPDLPSHRMVLRELHAPGDGSFLDQALLVVMREPHSYTGEEVVEIQCHGGPVHLSTILDAVFAAGARPAEAGEFTRRAFLNGRLDLVQAEAILDLVDARSEMSCQLARRHLQGQLSHTIEDIREQLAQALTLVEAAIDFSLEEHVYALDRKALAGTLEQTRREVEALLASYDRGRKVKEGIRCVIAGRPNSGKSTLFNRLLGLDRAITSATPGTTRDYLDAELVLDGQIYWLIDTAGIGLTGDSIEQEGIRRTRHLIEEADLVLLVGDASRSWESEDQALLEEVTVPGVFVWNKIDLGPPPPLPELPGHFQGPVPVSLISPSSLPPMITALREVTRKEGLVPSTESVAISRARHRDALLRAESCLTDARTSAIDGLGEEIVALDIRLALDAIGEIVGVVAPEDILVRIFSQFCIGK